MKKPEKYPILNFESFIGDAILLEGEKLFDEGAIQYIIAKSQNNWEAGVLDGSLFDLKLEVYGGTIRRGQCSCSGHLSDPCSHLVCAFFALRNQVTEAPAFQPEPREPRKNKPKTTVSEIIDRADPGMVKQFLLAHAKKDKSFKLLFTAHFARFVSDLRDENIYKALLDEAFPVLVEGKRISLSRNSQLMVKIVRELIILYEDALSLEQYTDAFRMIHAIIQKLAYAAHVLPKTQKTFTELEQKAHTLYKGLITDRLAPGLRHEIIQRLTETLSWSYYRYFRENNSIQLLMAFHPTREELITLDQVLSEKIQQTHALPYRIHLISYRVLVLFRLGDQDHSLLSLNTVLRDPYVVFEVLLSLTENGFLNEAAALADHLRSSGGVEERYYFQFRLKIGKARGNKAEVLEAARKLFELSYDTQYLRTLKEVAANEWPEVYKELTGLFTKPGPENESLLLTLVAWEKDRDLLAALLPRSADPGIFAQHDHLLVQSHPQVIIDHYRQFLAAYLKSHAGTQAVKKLAHIQEHLQEIGLGRPGLKLMEEMFNLFPERKSLLQLKTLK